jgi:alpha-amylase/alpha-mannosidase (GH57 family)
MSDPLYVTILWHMHQPYYKDPFRGEYLLPWTYLHAVKDYYDMAAIVEETPGARVTFNLVPSLLEQIEDYADGSAVDPFLLHGRMPPAQMSEDERLFVIENFFAANRRRMIEPHPRYRELLYLAGDGDHEKLRERLRHFRDQDILDLQVWFFLSWTGEAARRHHPELRELVHKEKNFTPADKELLFSVHRKILTGIIPLYRRLHEEGKAELAISPHFHPILPLLCDSRIAQEAMPRVTLPACRFHHPEDALRQIKGGIACFERIFGFPPAGMWPSEGSISDEALALMAGCGIDWAASDEDVLALSLPGGLGPGKEALYHPYRFDSAGGGIPLFFRDHTLSDLIGFTYSQWEPDRAVTDFIARLREIRRHAPGACVAPIILDGENAWEYYPDNGYHFLSALYSTLAATPGLKPATFGDVLAHGGKRRTLDRVHPGSWINANYGIWIGHPEENLAWDFLTKARQAAIAANPGVAARLGSRGDIPRPDEEQDETVRLICRSLLAAEGSDWFWWYGDDHFSPHSDRFDLLFRRHLMNVYRLLQMDIPRELVEPIKKKGAAGLVREPTAFISPVISGTVTDYFEWLAAGLYDLSRQHSAMHAAEALLQSLFYGYDRKYLYVRIDGEKALDAMLQPEDRLSLHLYLDLEYRLDMTPAGEEGLLLVKGENAWIEADNSCRWKIGRICEIAIPLGAIAASPGKNIFVALTLMRGGEEVGRWPTDAPMLLKYAGPDIEVENWLI